MSDILDVLKSTAAGRSRLKELTDQHAESSFAAPTGSANMPRKPIDIAHAWLKKSRQKCNGHISSWTPEQMDNYHEDLGLLVDFITDCWPNCDSATAGSHIAISDRPK